MLAKQKLFSKIIFSCMALSALHPACAAPTATPQQQKSTFEKVARKLNLSPGDLAASLVISSILLTSAAFIPDPVVKNYLRIISIIPPIIASITPKAAIDKLLKISIVKKIFKNNACSNEECEGICTECKARQFYIIPLLGGIIVFTIRFYKFMKNMDDQIDERLDEHQRLLDEARELEEEIRILDIQIQQQNIARLQERQRELYDHACMNENHDQPQRIRNNNIHGVHDNPPLVLRQTNCCEFNICQGCDIPNWNLLPRCMLCDGNPHIRFIPLAPQ